MSAPALIVEDGTVVANANSYISVAEAQLYFDARLYADDWNASDANKKSTSLQMATKFIDANTKWKGFQVGGVQTLAWPRIYVPDGRLSPTHWSYDPLAPYPQYGPVYPQSPLPKLLKDATAEMAGELLKIDRTAEWDALGVSSIGLGQGALSVSFTPGAEGLQRLFTSAVCAFLKPIGTPLGQNVSANVYRG